MSSVRISIAVDRFGLVVGERRGKQVIYGLHDSHVAELLDQAVFHVEHVRTGDRQPIARETLIA
jgi:hypothetical protein